MALTGTYSKEYLQEKHAAELEIAARREQEGNQAAADQARERADEIALKLLADYGV